MTFLQAKSSSIAEEVIFKVTKNQQEFLQHFEHP